MAGQIIILNGAPRAGKTSIAAAIQKNALDIWMTIGVDAVVKTMTPLDLQPGIGLRPGGERPDLEPFVIQSYRALFASVAAHAHQDLNVVVDVGLHENYSKHLGLIPQCFEFIMDLRVLVVSVQCPLNEILIRRRQSDPLYVSNTPGDEVPLPITLWQSAVTEHLACDLSVDTARNTPDQCANLILNFLKTDHQLTAAKANTGL